MRIRVLAIGMNPRHLTEEVTAALRDEVDYIVAADKGAADPLLALRRHLAEQFDIPLVAVPDPERDRTDHPDSASYAEAVAAWHEARVAAYTHVLRERGGRPAFLVWGDPALYDSTLRIVEQVATRLGAEYDVLPGISAPQLLAARHRIVLHRVGEPVLVTTARRLREDLAAGARNLVVMLTGQQTPDLLTQLARHEGRGDWSIWWGANLGTESEQLVHGRLDQAAAAVAAARERARAQAGFVMDLFLLRAP